MKNLFVADIDDTLLKASSENIAIIRKSDGKRFSTSEFATLKNVNEDDFSFKEFRNPKLVYESIVKGTPIIKNLRIMDSYINRGYKLSILTARGLEKTVLKSINNFLMYRDAKGRLQRIGTKLLSKSSACVNDPKWEKVGHSSAERKAFVLKQLCKKYKNVVYVDDNQTNCTEAIKLRLKNLTVIMV
jgi:hypothetical protein